MTAKITYLIINIECSKIRGQRGTVQHTPHPTCNVCKLKLTYSLQDQTLTGQRGNRIQMCISILPSCTDKVTSVCTFKTNKNIRIISRKRNIGVTTGPYCKITVNNCLLEKSKKKCFKGLTTGLKNKLSNQLDFTLTFFNKIVSKSKCKIVAYSSAYKTQQEKHTGFSQS